MKQNRNIAKTVMHNVNFLVCDSCATEVELASAFKHADNWATIYRHTPGYPSPVEFHYCPECVSGLKGVKP